MGYLSWLRNRQNQPARRLVRFRPRVEVLEGRCLPSTVTTLDDAGPGSLRDAVASTPSGGTVDFQADLTGTIVLTTGELAITRDLTIAGPGADVITISGNHASRVFNIGAAFTVDISGLTIGSGYTLDTGGGITNAGTLTLTNVSLSGNTAAFSQGGGDGGGIFTSGPLTVTNCTLSSNSAWGLGGGMYDAGATPVTVSGSTISRNQTSLGVGGGGGGLYNAGGTLVVDGCTLSGNTTDAGGAIMNNGGTLMVHRSTLSGNSGMQVGGGIFSVLGMATVSDSTVSGNQAGDNGGGGIYNLLGTLQVQNTIIAGNTSPFAPDLYGDLVDQGYNLIGGNPGLGPLQDNGGPTWTMAVLPSSPALNRGNPAQLGVADQRGVVRAGGVNIGAFQASASAFVLTAPDTATAGMPFDVTVTGVDTFGQAAVGYTGTVTFTATDSNPAVVLPANYTFTAVDAGVHTFAAGATLVSAGGQVLTATDTANGSLLGGATVAVNPAAADHFVLGVPASVSAGTPFDVTVTVVDAYGNTVPGYQGTVTFSSSDTDPGVVLPADYTFTPADGGSHTFSGGVTLITPGEQTLTVTDQSAGFSTSLTVPVTP
jgi:hypothetical protein